MVSEGTWMPWSESRQEYETFDATDNESLCERKCTFRNRFGVPPGDWRAVCVPPPSQLEAAPDLLAALKEVVMLAHIGQWHNEDLVRHTIQAAKAAIAKANGESS